MKLSKDFWADNNGLVFEYREEVSGNTFTVREVITGTYNLPASVLRSVWNDMRRKLELAIGDALFRTTSTVPLTPPYR